MKRVWGKVSTISPKWYLFLIAIVISIVSTIIASGTDSPVVEANQSIASVEQPIVPVEHVDPAAELLPIRLEIPKIHVDAAIESLGLTSGGAMAVPEGPSDAAWFNLGKRPGENGTAVIAGHSGWKNDIPAVFDDLHTLNIGDAIYVEDGRGVVTTFVVRELRAYDPNANAENVFASSDGKAHLNLITCDGAWDASTKSSSARLVVFADEE